jgi:hypothetical protein
MAMPRICRTTGASRHFAALRKTVRARSHRGGLVARDVFLHEPASGLEEIVVDESNLLQTAKLQIRQGLRHDFVL